MTRAAAEREWLRLTREVLPGLAASRAWPIRLDHCFQRVVLDAVCGGVWYDHISGRPAYRNMTDGQLELAVELAQGIAAGGTDLGKLNRQSLQWRKARRNSVR